ncbi:MAG TPA: MazG nucleotide pyrophosphohydrolase domain-containing protein [Acidimicrobiales bacterium]|nr:MazG nucleotide pyrophosphohydrolase domain-containing protein [Acidimicrobiales bacterium]
MPPRVVVVGLGPAGPDLLTVAAAELLTTAPAAFLRTGRHPAVAAAGLAGIATFDGHYQEADTFDQVYARIVDDLVAAATDHADDGPVVYGVPGSPLVAERTVDLLRADPRVDVTVVPALSFLDLAWDRLGVDPLAAGVRLVDGARFAEDAAGDRGPLLVAQCWSADLLSEIKLAVDTDLLPPGHPAPTATLLHHLGLPDEQVVTVDWADLDRALVPDHLTSVWLPSVAVPVARDLVALDDLVRRLRRDCPWDREQTHASLSRHLLEESYEVIDAIDDLTRAESAAGVAGDAAAGGVVGGGMVGGGMVGGGDREPAAAGDAVAEAVDHLEEELGDLLFQVYFHSCLAAEEGRFTLADVARGVHDKLVARHPHVFGDVVADDAGTVLGNWEQIKKAEKGRASVTDGIPAALPALALAAKLARKADSVPGAALPGFDEQRQRARAAVAAIPVAGRAGPPAGEDRSPEDGAELADELGDLLLVVVDLARRLGVDPEDALRQAALRLREHIREAEGS